MRKIILFILLSLFPCVIFGCESSDRSDQMFLGKRVEVPVTERNVTVPVCNINGEEITHITHCGMVSLTDEGIFYMSYSDEDTVDYYHYRFDNNETSKIGEIEDFAYEAVYDRQIINGHLYSFITTGDIVDSQNRVLHVYDFDLNSYSITEIYSQPGGFPYTWMESVGNDLVIMKDVNGAQSIEKYDTITRTFEPMVSYNFDNDLHCGDAVRHISTDGEIITVLRLSGDAEDVRLFLDCYDLDFNYISSLEISDLFSKTDRPSGEMKQGCVDLFFNGDVLYYENFSSTRFLVEISEDGFNELVYADDLFCEALFAMHNKKYKLFQYDFSNSLLIYNIIDNVLDNVDFYDPNDKYTIQGSRLNSKNDVLILMGYRDPNTGESLPDKLYLTNLSELSEL